MTVANLGDKEKQLAWVVFHLILGAVSAGTPWLLILWVYFIVGSTIFSVFTHNNRDGVVHFFLIYYLGIELLARMSKSYPFLPWESGKYFMLVLLIMGLLVEKRPLKSGVGIVILLLAVPSILVMPKDRFVKDLIFNSIGILNLGLALMYFYRRPVSFKDLARSGRIMMLGIISVLAFIIIRTPDLSGVEFTLNANFKTAGGFGSNQVSTILGLGFALVIVFNLLRIRLITFFRYGDMILFGLLFYRGLLTFSRGGILGGVICILLAFFVYVFSNNLPTPKIKLSNTILALGFLFTIAIFANQLTGNLLLLRYQGETALSVAGLGEKSYTTGRTRLMKEDLQIWYRNPIFGVGPGGAPKARFQLFNHSEANHTEFTRLLSEHGMFGLFINLIIFILPVALFLVSRDHELDRIVMVAFFTIALFSAAHNGMRTILTPLLYSFATIHVVYSTRKTRVPNTGLVQP